MKKLFVFFVTSFLSGVLLAGGNEVGMNQRMNYDSSGNPLYDVVGTDITKNTSPCGCEGPIRLAVSGLLTTVQIAQTGIWIAQKGYEMGDRMFFAPDQSYHLKRD